MSSSFRTMQPIGNPPLVPPREPEPDCRCPICEYEGYIGDFVEIDGELICDDFECVKGLASEMISKNTILTLENQRLKRQVSGSNHVA